MVIFQTLNILTLCLVGSQLCRTESLNLETAVGDGKLTQSSDDWRIELRQIDDEIKSSEDAKNRYLAAARRHEDEGMRWQFQQNQKQEAKRAYQKADTERQAAKMLQDRIDVLKTRRAQILQEHPGS